MPRYVIAGAGEAGTRAALALRKAGAGEVVLIGAEPHLPYERPPLSKPEGPGVTIRPIAPDFEGVDARFGVAVEAIDRPGKSLVLSDGSRIGYDRLLIAAGAQPRMLPSDPEGCALTLRTRADAEAIFGRVRPGGRAVIVGAGLIGLELTAELRKRGMEVTVIEAAPRALARALPEAVAAEIVARHVREGVEILFNAKIAAVHPSAIALENGPELPADLVVAAIGVTPDTRLAESAGLPCRNGIAVDAALRTADPDIFAAGDCVAIDHPRYGPVRFETWRNACDQGALAARAMMGEEVAFAAHPWFWSDQYDLGVQMIGLHDPARMLVRRDLPSGGWLLFELDERGVLRAASGIGPGRTVGKDVRLAEMLIEREACAPALALADASANLKLLLRAA